MMVARTGRPGRSAAASSAVATAIQSRVDGQRLHQLGAAASRMPRRQRCSNTTAGPATTVASRSHLGDSTRPGWRGRRRRRRRRRRHSLFQLKNLCATDDAAQW